MYSRPHLSQTNTVASLGSADGGVVASPRGTSTLGKVRYVEIARATQQFVNGKSHDFLAVFALAH